MGLWGDSSSILILDAAWDRPPSAGPFTSQLGTEGRELQPCSLAKQRPLLGKRTPGARPEGRPLPGLDASDRILTTDLSVLRERQALL